MKNFVRIGALAISILFIASVSEVGGRQKCCCCKNRQERGGTADRGYQDRDQPNWGYDRPINDQGRDYDNNPGGWDQRNWENDRPINDQGRNDGRDAGGNPADELKQVLELHNKYRREVAQGRVAGQPPSDKIRDLKWNDELARMAQAHSDKCGFNHNSYDERATQTFKYVGQNFAVFSSIKEGVDKWFEEHKDYDYNANSCRGVCGHYTQMVWADTTDLGCGATKCNYQGHMMYYLICHYGPTGNFNNQRPY
ncbi:hypothetical protein Aperf_G00000031439 [Anoplocephala perfoliata]